MSTKQLLIDIANGRGIINDSSGYRDDFLLSNTKKCTLLELYLLIQNLREFGNNFQDWPTKEKSFLEKLISDLPERKERGTYYTRVSFWFNRLPGWLEKIEYLNSAEKKYQVYCGYPEKRELGYDKFFFHNNLNEWEKGIDFDKLTQAELSRFFSILLTDLKRIERSEADILYIESQKFKNYNIKN